MNKIAKYLSIVIVGVFFSCASAPVLEQTSYQDVRRVPATRQVKTASNPLLDNNPQVNFGGGSNPSKKFQFQMNGKWLPGVHPLHAGANNFTTVQNLMPTETSYKTVDGYTKINTTQTNDVVNLHHFYKDSESHVIAKTNDSGTYELYENTTSIPSAGDYSGTALYTVDDGLGSFVNGPRGTMFYTDGTYSLIWGGDELDVGAFLIGDDEDTLKNYTQNVNNDLTSKSATFGTGGIDGYAKLMLHCNGTDGSTTFTDDGDTGHTPSANGVAQIDTDWSKFGGASGLFNGAGSYVSVPDHADWYMGTGAFTIDTIYRPDTYPFDYATSDPIFSQYVDGNNYVRLYTNGSGYLYFDIYSSSVNTVRIPTTQRLYHNTEYHIAVIRGWGGDSDTWAITVDGVSANTVSDSSEWPDLAASFDIGYDGSSYISGWVDEFRVSKGSARWTANFTPPTVEYSAGADFFYILSPLKLNGVKLYISNANQQGTSTLSGWHWTGSSWSSLSLTDGTASGGVSLAQTGSVTWPYSEDTEIKYVNGDSLYPYRFQVDAGGADIYKATVSAPLQPIRDVWNSSPRTVTSFQLDRTGSGYSDYTFPVFEADSTEDSLFAAKIGGMDGNGHIVVMADDRLSALSFIMVSGLVNTDNAQIGDILYHNGETWDSVSYFNDGTLDDAADSSFSKSGTLSWTPPGIDEEHPQEMFGKFGYVYRIEVDAALTSGSGNVAIDVVTGITAPLDMVGYDVCGAYNERVFLARGNKLDFSQKKAPWVFNGIDSSLNGSNTKEFGDENDIVALSTIYNRYGSNIIDALLVLKKNSSFVMTGSQPYLTIADPFITKQISDHIGCAAPMTLKTGEMVIGEGVNMNFAVWLDFSGPVRFNGMAPEIIPGLEYYFDQSNSDSINYSYIENSVSYMDYTEHQWNLLFPTGSSTTNNTWVVYDFDLDKWFEKVPGGTTPYLSATASVTDTNGAKYNYGATYNDYTMYLDNGLSWDGNAIDQVLTTGYFSPPMIDNFGFWSYSQIRGVRLISDAVVTSEKVTNGDMELDANWSNNGTPTTNERSSEQAHAGTYSRKFTVDAANEGIKSDTFTTVSGASYLVDLWVYPDDGTTVTVLLRHGDDGGSSTYNQTGLTQDAWNQITISYDEAAGEGGDGAYIEIQSGTSDSGTWYVDDVSITEDIDVTATIYNDGSASSNTLTLPTNGTGVITKNLNAQKNLAEKADVFQVKFSTSTGGEKWEPLAWGYKARMIRED